MRALSIGLISVGIGWALFVVWMYLTLAGIAEPISIAAVVGSFAEQMIGPVFLIVGPSLVMGQKHVKPGALLALVGSMVLSILVGYTVADILHPQPLQAPPPYGFYSAMIGLTLESDASAIWLCRRVFAVS